eukprot:scaffold674_cov130-Amphora_coffeaeformis.AAC.1
MYLALFDVAESFAHRVAYILNGTGLVVHHAAAALFISMVLAGVITPERDLLSPPLIVVMQHWFVNVRYVSQSIYITIELVLEFFFQWTILSNFEHFSSNHWTAALVGATMLVTHWFFFIAGGIELVLPSSMESKVTKKTECTEEMPGAMHVKDTEHSGLLRDREKIDASDDSCACKDDSSDNSCTMETGFVVTDSSNIGGHDDEQRSETRVVH